ncbi:MAG: HAMP domain-containing histidine kinase [Phaeodactylibacter sp.]|nr:HAMP domain-containing histidine kinase [Phaeodactylibacter sp.]
MKKLRYTYPFPLFVSWLLGALLLAWTTDLPLWKNLLIAGMPLLLSYVGMQYITNLRIRRIRKELFQILRTLESFRIDEPAPGPVEFVPTRYSLFRELQDYLINLIRRIQLDYTSNKQFTENAAHELQTPLAVIKGHIELLLQSPNIGEKEYDALGVILQNTNRLSKINQALILLTKIEHKRFQDEQLLDFKALLEEVLVNFKDTLRMYRLEFSTAYEEPLNYSMSKTLAEILLTNLIKNAIRHNLEDGYIRILLKDRLFQIENSGRPMEGDPKDLFKRFKRCSNTEESLGLGLSIVKRICTLYHLQIDYEVTGQNHRISIQFPEVH